jgi:biopolymer transport protein ExbB/TolQ
MRSLLGREAVFSVAALLISAILIQTIYATVIRPRAAAILAEPVAAPQDQTHAGQPETGAPGAVPSATPETAPGTTSATPEAAPAATSATTPVRNLRSVFVILKDYEQEVALILATWALCLIGYQAGEVARNRRLLDKDYIELGEGRVVLPDDARAYGRPIESLPRDEQEMLLPRALMVALNRFGATRSVQDSAEAVGAECENELDRLDAQLSMVRFTAWAIPAVGFVGTVRGIGRALQEAQGALHGDISGVTLGLGVTFNATLTALVACIIVMFFLHQLQQAQDRLVLDARMYIDRRLIRNMRVH